MAKYLRKRGELLSAARLMPLALKLAEAVKNDVPPVFVLAHHEAADLDAEFERFDSALDHMSIALQRIEQGDFARRDVIACRANYARLLRKLKRFDEAEQIYLKLIEETNRDPEGLSERDLSNLRFALAVVYADKGLYQQYFALSDGGREQINEQEDPDPERAITMTIVFVNYSVSVGEDLTVAADKAQELVEWTQKSYGVSSSHHVEAIELLAKVRISQSRYDDAIALLKKSAELRVGLLGPDHPSIAKLHKEVDAVRKTQLDAAEPIWTPLDSNSDWDSTDKLMKQ
jgi:tetratricopeptide (TPR) repeat protein